MSLGFDTLRAAEALTHAGIDASHAKAIVSTMSEAIGAHVATKADLADAKQALKADIADVRREIAELKAALTWRIVLALGAFAALTRLWG